MNKDNMFKILGCQKMGFTSKDEGINAIIEEAMIDKSKWLFVHNLYTWGYIQGIRAERARNKIRNNKHTKNSKDMEIA